MPDDPDGNGLGGWTFLTDLGEATSDAYPTKRAITSSPGA